MSRFSEPMTATKALRYNTRHLVAGEGFMASPKDVRVLEAIGKAKRGRPAADVPEIPETLRNTVASTAPATTEAAHPLDHDGDGAPGGSIKQADPDIGAVRAEYQTKTGKRPFPGWDIAQLRRRMGDA